MGRMAETTLEAELESVKYPSHKFIKLAKWCRSVGLDLVIKRYTYEGALVLVLTRSDTFRVLLYMKDVNMREYVLTDQFVTMAREIARNYNFYLENRIRPNIILESSESYPVTINYRGGSLYYSRGEKVMVESNGNR